MLRHVLVHEQSNRVRGRLPSVVSRALVSPAVQWFSSGGGAKLVERLHTNTRILEKDTQRLRGILTSQGLILVVWLKASRQHALRPARQATSLSLRILARKAC